MSKFAVVGAHGKVARFLLPILASGGHTVVGLVRDKSQLADIAADGVEPRLLDAETASESDFADAFAGADAVVWSAGAGGGAPERTYAVDRDAAIRSIDAAKRAGVNRYLLVSWLGSKADHGVDPADGFFPYTDAKFATDEYLRGTSLDWTILAPGILTLEPGTGRITIFDGAVTHGQPGTVGGRAISEAAPTASRENVALTVAAALGISETIGHFIPFGDGDTPIEEALRALH